MVDCKPISTLVSLARSDNSTLVPYADPTQYRSLTGALQYLTITCPDLSFAVNKLCQHMHVPTTADSSMLKRVLRYVKGTVGFGLHIMKSVFADIHAFRIRIGLAIRMTASLLAVLRCTWCTVTWSSTKAGYKAMVDVSAEPKIKHLRESHSQTSQDPQQQQQYQTSSCGEEQ
ncbi:PREDICTED: uncharacterized protein LOC109157411 [Ipomoea nil]|uniref:uncharacterized protein LOC109157411 n=1 Tax=Ipomoea nil TaxID=35883 RepID=UPI0009018CC1|nr:PREDICTED: uncharacterized protein LOC109157411 [Ipomoea nil]